MDKGRTWRERSGSPRDPVAGSKSFNDVQAPRKGGRASVISPLLDNREEKVET